MSYYEWVSNLKMLQTSPMDDNIIKNLENKKNYQNDYIRVKLFKHVLNTVNTRLNNAGYDRLERIFSSAYNIDTLSLDFINLKKEHKFVLKISQLSAFDQETQMVLIDSIERRYNDICDMLRKNIKYVDTDGSCIVTFEKIMSSNMEG